MTLEEKASLCSGEDFWRTKAIERLGIPKVHLSDGPMGLRKQAEGGDHLGVNDSIKAVCFPSSCATTASFDRELVKTLGETLGEECRAEQVAVILGPAINIKRSPLCGRNFEYLSEDPYLAGEMAASYIRGVQSKEVGTSVKHFALNNQEYDRMSISAEADERTIREIYFPAYEKAVKESQPWTVMCSYNRINGEFASENEWLLTDVLRKEWGFEGFVVSDWGAVNDRVKGIAAGMDLEMPGSGGDNDRLIVEAVKQGKLPEEKLDLAVERILSVIEKYIEPKTTEKYVFDKEKDHSIATDLATECIVLLKNEEDLLPLKKEDGGLLFIGGFAEKPRFQGGGSAHINCERVDDALSACRKRTELTYTKGFAADSDARNEEWIREAVSLAEKAEKVVIFAGLPDSYESEGYDRSHMRLPAVQNEVIEKVSRVNPNVVVVLHNGSPVEMPWASSVRSILEAYLCGEGVGEAEARILFGEKNPSGKLAETFPLRLEDNPSYLNFPGWGGKVEYHEGIFVGYRYYDKKKLNVLFPFGYGLSYTDFELKNLTVDRKEMSEGKTLTVKVDVTNTGKMAGKEVVQLYVSDRTDAMLRPEKELKGFEKVELAPGETKTVTMTLDYRSFACYDADHHEWYAPSGNYEIRVGTSSVDLPLTERVTVTSKARPFKVTPTTTYGEIAKHPSCTKEVMAELMKHLELFAPKEDKRGEAAKEAITNEMQEAMQKFTPLRALRSFQQLSNEKVQELCDWIDQLLEGKRKDS